MVSRAEPRCAASTDLGKYRAAAAAKAIHMRGPQAARRRELGQQNHVDELAHRREVICLGDRVSARRAELGHRLLEYIEARWVPS